LDLVEIQPNATHIYFEGSDELSQGNYGSSVPLFLLKGGIEDAMLGKIKYSFLVFEIETRPFFFFKLNFTTSSSHSHNIFCTNALIAYKMNEEHLTPDHGYPVRALLPGKPILLTQKKKGGRKRNMI